MNHSTLTNIPFVKKQIVLMGLDLTIKTFQGILNVGT